MLGEYGRLSLRRLDENAWGGQMADGGKKRRLEVDGNGRVVLGHHGQGNLFSPHGDSDSEV